jgi:hypothetical protein
MFQKAIVIIGVLALTTLWSGADEVAERWMEQHGKKTEAATDASGWAREAHPLAEKITEISLERTPCFGACPVYSVVIKSDGTLRYHGSRFVKRLGNETGKVNEWHLARLKEFIIASGYTKLKPNYAVRVTDQPGTYTSVVIDGKRYSIKTYGSSAPASLYVIEQLIDKLVSEATWDKAGKDEKALRTR